ncbi:MAG: hypothetical protein ACTHL7_06005 [Steroidobacteraceae bacterium]
MSRCTTPLPMERLIEYWFDDAQQDQDSSTEEHLFVCATCSERLLQLAAISAATKEVVAAGDFGAIITGPFVARLKEAGLRVREYRVPPGGSVLCTIAPHDDLVVGRMRASLHGIERLDVVVHVPARGSPARLENVPFNTEADEVIFAPGAAYLRTLGTLTQRQDLVAVAGADEKVIGHYTFNHHPYAV